MATLVYAPGIRVKIDTEKNGILDVTDDLESGSLTIAEEQPSQFNFTLLNHKRKYDGVFMPNDRITVQMKRIRWVQVFSGYLDTVPYFSAAPRSVPLSATDRLKKLQYTLWDAGSQAAWNLLSDQGSSGQAIDGQLDSAIGNKIMTMLTTPELGGFEREQVHIGAIPQTWFSKIAPIYKSVTARLPAGIFSDANLTSGTAGAGPASLSGVPQEMLNAYKKFGGKLENGPQWHHLAGVGFVESGHNTNPAARSDNFAGAAGPMQFLQSTFNNINRRYDLTGRGVNTGNRMVVEDAVNAAAHLLWEYGEKKWNDPNYVRRGLENYNGGPGQSEKTRQNETSKYATKVLAQADKYLKESIAQGNLANSSGNEAEDITGRLFSQTDQTDLTTKFLAAAHRAIGIPYQQRTDINYKSAQLPAFFDCSSLVMWSLFQVGIVDFPRTSGQQSAACTRITVDEALNTAGALLFDGDKGLQHVAISLGDGHTTLQARKPGTLVQIVDSPNGYNFGHGGLIPKLGSKVGQTANVAAPGNLSGNGSLFNQVWGGQVNVGASLILSGPLALMNDDPILSTIAALCHSSMRKFMAAPNGDFIAWFPDYFGVYGTAAKMIIEDIEILNDGFSMMWSDKNLITHQYTAGNKVNLNNSIFGDAVDLISQYATKGVASIDFPEIMQALFNIDNDPNRSEKFFDPEWIYKRFGARKNYTPMGNIFGGQAEFWAALFLFQQNWSSQFSATVRTTFMPELWPGMLVSLPKFKFQAYVESVTHTFGFEQGAGFKTNIGIIAPSATAGSGLYALPRGE